MTTTTTAPKTSTHNGTSEDDVAHIVSKWQGMLDILRLKVPRALCGELLVADPDRPGPNRNSPICPRCAELDGQRRG